jgi:hypothetical protein
MPVKLFCGGPWNGKEVDVDRHYWIVTVVAEYWKTMKLTGTEPYDVTKDRNENHYYEAGVFCGREVMIYRGPW